MLLIKEAEITLAFNMKIDNFITFNKELFRVDITWVITASSIA